MNSVKEISTTELEEKLNREEKLNLVDVREDDEVATGIIPSAKHIKMGDIPNHLDHFSKDEEYIFICRSGARSERVCQYMQQQGYNVKNMVGGMLEWSGDKA
ncbi:MULTISPECIES: rhodanese-like domain-containing protein [Bacillaceae]|uniref:rhodanese-like domain-containing protein n=1 Tax=Bacillaceae TaxID=186817 RepID=UPI002A169F64|nr:rhodanese-like domain-containing protein [Cytobacillus sp. IB215316]MDX8359226.1 rhodanese-like domain-containing protein [Cytobacillus sp. IB215316]